MCPSALQPLASPDAATDLPEHLPDRAAIERLVHAFYARARTDRLLGPVLETTVEDWSAHVDTLVRFWRSVLLRTGGYAATRWPRTGR